MLKKLIEYLGRSEVLLLRRQRPIGCRSNALHGYTRTSILLLLRATPTIMQMDLAFTKMHKTPKKPPPIVMHLDYAFYIAMNLEGETWHICQRSPAMQIEITGFSVPPRGLFSSLRAVSLHAATTSRDRRCIARPPSPASRARFWT